MTNVLNDEAGSSPRMRGTLYSPCPMARCTGIIPAYAGNTAICLFSPVSRWDHPRVCGEHHWRKYFYSPYTGSSPRMRGTPASRSLSPRPNGIIPAYAGNTSAPRGAVERIGDHPRVCGEHVPSAAMGMIGSGSSPRMRGTHGRHIQNRKLAGIIPAYAGNTHASVTGERAKRDHPHVCGEHACGRAHVQFVQGSSPRMRGTRVRAGLIPLGFGIIPAYAGNTQICGSMTISDGDHPRVCGEHPPRPVSGCP